MADGRNSRVGRRSVLAGTVAGVASLMVGTAQARRRKSRTQLFQGPLAGAEDYDDPTWTFVRAKRLDMGMTVAEMAWCLGVSPSTVRRYERGAKVPRPAKLIYLMMGSALVFTRNGTGALHNVACSLLSKGHGASLPPEWQAKLDPPFYGIRDDVTA